MLRLTTSLALLALAACVTPSGSSGSDTSRVVTFQTPQLVERPDLDVLFVVDGTPAMADARVHIAESVESFEAALFAPGLPPPNLHVAAITADASAPALRRVPAIAGPYLVDELAPDDTRATNYTGTFANALGELLDAGAADPAPLQPLEAARRALATAGDFLRPGAALAVIVIASGDDASPDGVARYAQAFQGYVPDPALAVVGGIYPQPEPRLDALLDAFPGRAGFAPLDGDDLAAALAPTALGVQQPAISCLPAPLDLDPGRPGGQYDCTIEATIEDRTGRHRQVLPVCPADGETDAPCWTVDATRCAAPDVEYRVENPPGGYQPALAGQCVIGP